MKELTILRLCLIFIFIYINYLRKCLYLTKVESSLNGKEYYVRKLPDNLEAANMLAELGLRLKQLVDSLGDKDRKEEIDRLKENFNHEHITENIPGSMYVAYSVNKGEELSICIREKDTEKFLDINTIMFVSIHELSHIMTEDTGHTPRFWANMKYLLEESSKLGIYNPVDYSKNPAMYCGTKITSTPMNL